MNLKVMFLLPGAVLSSAAFQMQFCQLVVFSCRQVPVEESMPQGARRRKTEIQIEFALTGRL
jgi:hypothetical protein